MPAALLSARFRILTPMFIGDAFQRPRLRAPGVKGAMRFWYRAISPSFMDEQSSLCEARLFGGQGNGAGQSPWLLTVEGPGGKLYSWNASSPGLRYLGYPFGLGRGEPRQALATGREFTVHCLVPREGDNPELRRALAATLWCLGHFGAMGSRSRRGFGAAALVSWEAAQGDWPELDELPLLKGYTLPGEATAALDQTLELFRQWFGDFKEQTSDDDEPKFPNPHIGPAFRRHIGMPGYPAQQWDRLLESMGSQMQKFRSRTDPDYSNVKNHLRGGPIDQAPERASFGLPLTFRYRSLNGKNTTFLPVDPGRRENLERHGSLLLLRPVLLGEKLFPLHLRMDGAVPGVSPPAGTRFKRRPLKPPRNAMDAFFNQIAGGRG